LTLAHNFCLTLKRHAPSISPKSLPFIEHAMVLRRDAASQTGY